MKLGQAAAVAIFKGIFGVFRYTLYVLLLLVGRVLMPVTKLAVAVGLMLFLFCVVFRRDQVTPMWAGAGLAVSAVVVTIMYETLLRLVAPDDALIVTDL